MKTWYFAQLADWTRQFDYFVQLHKDGWVYPEQVEAVE